MTFTLHRGNALEVLPTLPEASVDAVVTSPPYWGLRQYADAEGQFGLERTPEDFVANLVAIGRELWRVLKPGGNWLLNLGDSYAQVGGPGWQGKNVQRADRRFTAVRDSVALRHIGRRPPVGLKPKDLIGIPWSVAFALRDAGWWLRAEIIWHKPNGMPESVRDRVTRNHETVFHLTNAERYYWNADAIKTAYAESTLAQFEVPYEGQGRKDYAGSGVQDPSEVKRRILKRSGNKARRLGDDIDRPGHHRAVGVPWEGDGANARSVWTINTEPSPFEHFAVMPRALARKCVLASCPPGGVVLDPFAGVCTTGAVALEEGRSFVGIELSPKYHALGRNRLADVAPLFAQEVSA